MLQRLCGTAQFVVLLMQSVWLTSWGLVSSYRWHVCRADWESREPPEVSDKAVWLLPLQMVRASIPCLSLLVFTVWVVQYFVAGLVFRAAFYSWHRFYICINLHRWGRVLIMRGWDFAIWSPNLTWNFLWYLKRQIVTCELAAFNLILAPKVCCIGMSSLFCLWLASKWTGCICCLRIRVLFRLASEQKWGLEIGGSVKGLASKLLWFWKLKYVFLLMDCSAASLHVKNILILLHFDL